MKFSTKFNALVLGLAVLAFGCKEDKNNDPAPAPANVEAAVPECLLLQDSTTNGWVNIYKYNAKGQGTHITRKRPGTYPYFETPEYDAAGKLLRNNFHINDSVIYAYNQYQYNAAGLISSSTYFRWEVNYGP